MCNSPKHKHNKTVIEEVDFMLYWDSIVCIAFFFILKVYESLWTISASKTETYKFKSYVFPSYLKNKIIFIT